MGTTKCGRYPSTQGGRRIVSDYALVHSEEGDFKWRNPRDVRKNGPGTNTIRLANGGHGDKGMRLLEKYHIEYQVVKTYPNGVRVGWVPDHANSKKRHDQQGQSWFPKSWTAKDIRRAGEHVAGLRCNRNAANGVKIFGVYKGVLVGVVRTNGMIATIFPVCNQSNRRKMKPKRRKTKRNV